MPPYELAPGRQPSPGAGAFILVADLGPPLWRARRPGAGGAATVRPAAGGAIIGAMRRCRWAGLALLVVVLAGCSAGPATSSSRTTTSTVPLRRLSPPGCSDAAAPESTLATAKTATAGAGDQPFGVAVSRDDHYLFVAGADGVEVFSLTATDAGGLPARPLRTVPLGSGGDLRALGVALTPDGQYLLVAVDRGLVVLRVAALENGGAAVLGSLLGAGYGGIEVTASADGRFAFESFENSDTVGVYDVARALQDGFGAAGVTVGTVPVGVAPVGITTTADGRFLYVTSEDDPSAGLTRPKPSLTGPRGAGATPGCGGEGSLSVIEVASAEADPSKTGRVVAPAGSQPVRVTIGDGGAVAWVTARGSDALLGFSTSRLDSASTGHLTTDALVADVPVGAAPVGVASADGGKLVVVADSNRFASDSGPQWISVVDAAAALAGRPALLGQVAAGTFPRDLTVSPDGSTVFASDYGSNQVEAVAVGGVAGG
jgi:DNA-binding beta-propeller fold protein YncE